MFVINFDLKHSRKKAYFIIVILLLLVAMTVKGISKDIINYISAYEDVKDKGTITIILDPGHGGEDSGAIGTNGVYEKDLNLLISNTIGELLKANGYKVIYTRTEDKMLYTKDQDIKGIRKISDLRNRCKIANENIDALFISIHMNSYSEEKYKGLQVYYSVGNEKSKKLAEHIQSSVKDSLQKDNNRKIKEGKGLYLLEHIKSTGVLIECGFLSNIQEAKKLSEKEYQKQLSFSIICGIIEYIEDQIQ